MAKLERGRALFVHWLFAVLLAFCAIPPYIARNFANDFVVGDLNALEDRRQADLVHLVGRDQVAAAGD